MATSHATVLSAEIKATLDKYADFLWARCSLERTTIDNYVQTIKRMLLVTGADPDKEVVEQYYGGLRRAGLSYAYSTYICVGIERFMEMRGTPVSLGRVPKPKRVLKRVLSESEVTLLIASAKTVRTRAMLAVLAFSGIRNEEFCLLKMDDVDVGGNTLHIAGKGARERKVCVSSTCMEALLDYIHERKQDGARPTDRLFVTHRHGYDLEQQDIRKMIRSHAKRAGLKCRVHPHLLRHSLATNLLKRGSNLLAIRDQLGHEFLSSTLGYIHVTIKDLRMDYDSHAPCYM